MSQTQQEFGLRLDPSLFEIIRHRLWYLNDEGALTISRLSGSPVATEVFDMNTGLMTASGDLVYIDNFICAQATTLSSLVRHLREHYADNPGFGPEDTFLCNDPYISVCHQTCVQVAGPVFWEDEIVAWTGASLHVIDVGGPLAGQVQVDAADVFGEQPLTGPIKIVESGRFRRDVENTFTRNSRLPDLLALDLRAKVAASQVIRRRLLETFAEFGPETVLAAMDDVVDYTERRLRARLAELPDGTWRHRAYIEFGDRIYDCHVTLTKQGDHLVFDFERDRRPGAGRHQLHRPRARRRRARGRDGLPLLGHPVVARGRRAGAVRQVPGGLRRPRELAGRRLEVDDDVDLAGAEPGQHRRREDAGRERAPSRAGDGRLAGRQGPRGAVRHRTRRQALRRAAARRHGRRRRSAVLARRNRHRRSHELAARHDRERRELRAPLPDPLPVPPPDDRLRRRRQVPRRRGREHALHGPRGRGDSDQDPAHLRRRAARVAGDGRRLPVDDQPLRDRARVRPRRTVRPR